MLARLAKPLEGYIMSREMIITGPKVFNHKYVPPEVKFRQQHIKKMLFCLQNGHGTVNTFLFGPSGSGKSVTIQHVLGQVSKDTVIVNCFESRTLQAVLERILAKLQISKGLRTIRNGLLDLPKASTTQNKERLRRYLKENHIVLVLEEIDRAVPKVREEMLYNLCRIENLTLILTAQNKLALQELDERVCSRVNAVEIEFSSYTQEQLKEMLRKRAGEGLVEGSYDEDVLRTVAEMSYGNARTAIGILERLALLAECGHRKRIDRQDVEQAWQTAKNAQQLEKLQGLSRHHTLLYEVIVEHGEVVSSVLRREYYQRCKLAGLKPVAPRTLRDYPGELVKRRLVRQEPGGAGTRGEAKLYRPL
jgi:cell division control protein 6